jgi:hypothetical protein
MWRRVYRVRTRVSEESISSFFRMESVSKLETLEVTGKRLLLVNRNVSSSLNLFTLMTEVISSSEMLVLTRGRRRHIPEDGILNAYQYLSMHYASFAESSMAAILAAPIRPIRLDHVANRLHKTEQAAEFCCTRALLESVIKTSQV